MAPKDQIFTPGDEPAAHGQNDHAPVAHAPDTHAQAPVPNAHAAPQAVIIQIPSDGGTVTLPDAHFMLTADYARHGADLILTDGHGHEIILRGYFNAQHPPDLHAESGATIAADLVAKLAGPLAPGQYAQAGGDNALGAPIGHVDQVKGVIKITHADGTHSELHKGDQLYQNDQIQSGDGASAGLILADGSSLSIGQASRMVLDDLVYDPSAKTGNGQVELLAGTATFVSGQIAKTTPDAFAIKTPVTSIGIRGTAGGVSVDQNGGTSAALLAETNGSGEISIGGVVINQPGLMSTVSEAGGQGSTPTQISPQQFGQLFGSALSSLPNASEHINSQVLGQAIQSFQQQQQNQQQQQQQQQQNQGDPPHTQLTPEQHTEAVAIAAQLNAVIKGAIDQATRDVEHQIEQGLIDQSRLQQLIDNKTAELLKPLIAQVTSDAAATQHDILTAANAANDSAIQEAAVTSYVTSSGTQWANIISNLASSSTYVNSLSQLASSATQAQAAASSDNSTAADAASRHAEAAASAAATNLALTNINAAVAQIQSLLQAAQQASQALSQQGSANTLSPTGFSTTQVDLVHTDASAVSTLQSTITTDQHNLSLALSALNTLRTTVYGGLGEQSMLLQDATYSAQAQGTLVGLNTAEAAFYDASLALEAWNVLDGVHTPTLTLQTVDLAAGTLSTYATQSLGSVNLTTITTDLAAAIATTGATRLTDVVATQADAQTLVSEMLKGYADAYANIKGTTLTLAANGNSFTTGDTPATLATSGDATILNDPAVQSWYVAWQMATATLQAVDTLSTSVAPDDVTLSAVQLAVQNNLGTITDSTAGLAHFYGVLEGLRQTDATNLTNQYSAALTSYNSFHVTTVLTAEASITAQATAVDNSLAQVLSDTNLLSIAQGTLAHDLANLAIGEAGFMAQATQLSNLIAGQTNIANIASQDAQTHLKTAAAEYAAYQAHPDAPNALTLLDQQIAVETTAILSDIASITTAHDAAVALQTSLSPLVTAANSILTQGQTDGLDATYQSALQAIVNTIGSITLSASNAVSAITSSETGVSLVLDLAAAYDPQPVGVIAHDQILAYQGQVSASVQAAASLNSAINQANQAATLANSLFGDNSTVHTEYLDVLSDLQHEQAAAGSITVIANTIASLATSSLASDAAQAQNLSAQAGSLAIVAQNYAYSAQTDAAAAIQAAITAAQTTISQSSATIQADYNTVTAQAATVASALTSASNAITGMFALDSNFTADYHAFQSASASIYAAGTIDTAANAAAQTALTAAQAAAAALGQLGGLAVGAANSAGATVNTLTGLVGTIAQDAATAGDPTSTITVANGGAVGTINDESAAVTALNLANGSFQTAKDNASSAAQTAISQTLQAINASIAAQSAADQTALTAAEVFVTDAENLTGFYVDTLGVTSASTSTLTTDARTAFAHLQSDFNAGNFSAIAADATAVSAFVPTVQADFNAAASVALGHQPAFVAITQLAALEVIADTYAAQGQAMAAAAANATAAANAWATGSVISGYTNALAAASTANAAVTTAQTAETTTANALSAIQSNTLQPAMITYAGAQASDTSYQASLGEALSAYLVSMGWTVSSSSLPDLITTVTTNQSNTSPLSASTINDIMTSLESSVTSTAGSATLSGTQSTDLTALKAAYTTWNGAQTGGNLTALQTAMSTFLTAVSHTPATTGVTDLMTAAQAYVGSVSALSDQVIAEINTDLNTAVGSIGSLTTIEQAWQAGYTATYNAYSSAYSSFVQASLALTSAQQQTTIANSQALAAQSAFIAAEASYASAVAAEAGAQTAEIADEQMSEVILKAAMTAASTAANTALQNATQEVNAAQTAAAQTNTDVANGAAASVITADVAAIQAAITQLQADVTAADAAAAVYTNASISAALLPSSNSSLAPAAALASASAALSQATADLARIVSFDSQVSAALAAGTNALSLAQQVAASDSSTVLAHIQTQSAQAYAAALAASTVALSNYNNLTTAIAADTVVLHADSTTLSGGQTTYSSLHTQSTVQMDTISLAGLSHAIGAVSALITPDEIATSIKLSDLSAALASAQNSVSLLTSTITGYGATASGYYTQATNSLAGASAANASVQAATTATSAATSAQTVSTAANTVALEAQNIASLQNSIALNSTIADLVARDASWAAAANDYFKADSYALAAQTIVNSTINPAATTASGSANTIALLYGQWNGNANAQIGDATSWGQLLAAEQSAQSALAQLNSALASVSASLGSSSLTNSALGQANVALADYAATAILAQHANALATAQAEQEAATAAQAAQTYYNSILTAAGTNSVIAADIAVINAALATVVSGNLSTHIAAAAAVEGYVTTELTQAGIAKAKATDASSQLALVQSDASQIYNDLSNSTSTTTDKANLLTAQGSVHADFLAASAALAAAQSAYNSATNSTLTSGLTTGTAGVSASLMQQASTNLASAQAAYSLALASDTNAIIALTAATNAIAASSTTAIISAIATGISNNIAPATSLNTDAQAQFAAASAALHSVQTQVTALEGLTGFTQSTYYASATNALAAAQNAYNLASGAASLAASELTSIQTDAASATSAASVAAAQGFAADAKTQLNNLSVQDQVAALEKQAAQSALTNVNALTTAYANYSAQTLAAQAAANATLTQTAENAIVSEISANGASVTTSENYVSSGTLTTHSAIATPLSSLTQSIANVTAMSLTLLSAGGAAHGTVSISNGTITYTPNAYYVGTDTITYSVGASATLSTTTTGFTTQATDTLTVNVSYVEQQTTLSPISLNVTTNSSLALTTASLLAAYSSPDQSTLADFMITALPTHGTLDYNGSIAVIGTTLTPSQFANLVYIPNSGYLGTDNFLIESTAGTIWSQPSTVTLGVVPPTISLASGATLDLSTITTPGAYINAGGTDTILTGGTVTSSITLNATGHTSIFDVSAMGDGGFLGAYQSGSDAIFQLTSTGGGGQLTVVNQFNGQGFAYLETGNGKTETLVGSAGGVTGGTLTGTSGDDLILANLGETLVQSGGGHDNFFLGGGNQTVYGTNSWQGGTNFIGGQANFVLTGATSSIAYSTGPIQVDKGTGATPSGVHAIALGNGYTEVVFNDAATNNILAQQYDANGVAVGAVQTLANAPSLTDIQTASTSNGIEIAWEDYTGTIHLINDAFTGGTATVASQTVNSVFTGMTTTQPMALTNAAAGALNLVWGNSFSLESVTFNPTVSATLTGTTLAVDTTYLSSVQATALSDGAIVTVFSDNAGNSFLQSSDLTSGTLALYDYATGLQIAAPHVAGLGTSFVVAGAESISGSAYIMTERFSASGTLVANGLSEFLTTYDAISGVQVAALTGGGYVVDWVGTHAGVNTLGVMVVTPQGYESSSFSLANSTNYGGSGLKLGNIIALSDGGFDVTWLANDGSPGVYTQQFDAIGNAVGTVALNGTSSYTDTLHAIDSVTGTAGNDIFTLGAGQMTFNASGGYDYYNGSGLGDNTVSYRKLGGGVTINLNAGSATKSTGGVDTLSGVTSVIGSAYADTITAGNLAGAIYVLDGGGGADTLIGGTQTTATDYFVIGANDGANVTGGSGYNVLEFEQTSSFPTRTNASLVAMEGHVSGINAIDLNSGGADLSFLTFDANSVLSIAGTGGLILSGGGTSSPFLDALGNWTDQGIVSVSSGPYAGAYENFTSVGTSGLTASIMVSTDANTNLALPTTSYITNVGLLPPTITHETNYLHFNSGGVVALSAPSSLATGTNPFTYAVWVRTTATGTEQLLMTIGNISAIGQGAIFSIDGTGHLAFHLSSESTVSSPNSVADNQWHYVAVTYSGGSSGTAALYVDGHIVNSAAQSSVNLTSGNAVLGAFVTGAQQYDYYLNGDMAQAGIWSTQLLANDFAAQMASETPVNTSNLLAYFPLNEDMGSTAIDASGNGHDGSISPMGTAWAHHSTLITVEENAAYQGVLTATDILGKVPTWSLAHDAHHGTVTLLTNGSFTYTPASAYLGVDQFTVTAADNVGNSTSQIITMDVSGIVGLNDATVQSGQSIHQSLTVVGLDRLASASSATNDFEAVITAGHGIVSLGSKSDPYAQSLVLGGNGTGTLTIDAHSLADLQHAMQDLEYTASTIFSGIDTVSLNITENGSAVLSQAATYTVTAAAPSFDTDTTAYVIGPNTTTSAYYKSQTPSTQTTNITVQAWVKWDGSPLDGGGGGFIFYNGKPGVNGYGLRIFSDGSISYFNESSGGGGSGPGAVTANTWTQLTLVNTNGVWAIYVNGVAQTLSNNSVPALAINANSDPFTIGNDGTGYGFAGQIASVAMWNTALSQPDIATTMASGINSSNPNLVQVWDFNTSAISVGGVAGNGQIPSSVMGQTSLTVFQQPTHGTIAFTDTMGDYTYTPTAGFFGVDSFAAQATNSGGTTTVTQYVDSVAGTIAIANSQGSAGWTTAVTSSSSALYSEVIVTSSTLSIEGSYAVNSIAALAGSAQTGTTLVIGTNSPATLNLAYNSYVDVTSKLEVDALGGLVMGNQMTMLDAGTLVLGGGNLSGGTVTVTGELDLIANSTLNSILILDQGSGVSDSLGSYTISGNGEFINRGHALISGTPTIDVTFLNDVGGVLDLSGTIGNVSLTLGNYDANNGLIVYDAGGQYAMTINNDGYGFTNNGTIDVSYVTTNSSFYTSDFVNNGLIKVVGGSVYDLYISNLAAANHGAIDILDSSYLNISLTTGGTYTNDSYGVIDGGGNLSFGSATLVNQGTIEVQNDHQTLAVTSASTVLDNSSDVVLHYGSAGASELTFSGAVQFGGTLDFQESSTPVVGSSFTVETATSNSGSFETINGLFDPHDPTWLLDPTFANNSIGVTVQSLSMLATSANADLFGQYLVGGVSDSTMTATSDHAVMLGQGGNDTFVMNASQTPDFIDGGGGFNNLIIQGAANSTINLSLMQSLGEHIERVQEIDLTQITGATLNIDANSVAQMSHNTYNPYTLATEGTNAAILIEGNAGAIVNLTDKSGWSYVGTSSTITTPDGHSDTYQVYSQGNGSVNVLIGHNVTVNPNNSGQPPP